MPIWDGSWQRCKWDASLFTVSWCDLLAANSFHAVSCKSFGKMCANASMISHCGMSKRRVSVLIAIDTPFSMEMQFDELRSIHSCACFRFRCNFLPCFNLWNQNAVIFEWNFRLNICFASKLPCKQAWEIHESWIFLWYYDAFFFLLQWDVIYETN